MYNLFEFSMHIMFLDITFPIQLVRVGMNHDELCKSFTQGQTRLPAGAEVYHATEVTGILTRA